MAAESFNTRGKPEEQTNQKSREGLQKARAKEQSTNNILKDPGDFAGKESAEKISQTTRQQATPDNDRSRTKTSNIVKAKKINEKFKPQIAPYKPVYSAFDTPVSGRTHKKASKDPNAMALKKAAIIKSEDVGPVIGDGPTGTSRRELRRVGNTMRLVDIYQKDDKEYLRYKKNYKIYEEHYDFIKVSIHDENTDKQAENKELYFDVRVRDVIKKVDGGYKKYKIESIEGEKTYSTGGELVGGNFSGLIQKKEIPGKGEINFREPLESNPENERLVIIDSILLERLRAASSEEKKHQKTDQTTNQ